MDAKITNSLANKLISEFKKVVGDTYVYTDPEQLNVWGKDWTKVFPPNPLCIVLPANTAQVSEIMKICSLNKQPVVPSGGRTGLVAGAVATNQEVVLSLHRMSRILEVDAVGLTIQVEAGVTTEAVQEAAKHAGLFFPLDLAAKGSCQIGGNIASNAGGVKLIRFGGTREQVLGVEVVLADGEVLNLNSSLRKNNSGYDLKQFFIGSEGTLGIVTKATLKLATKPRGVQLSLMATQKFADIPRILELCHKKGAMITAFEFFTDVAHKIVLKHQPNARTPFDAIAPFYVLLETEEGKQEDSNMEALLESLFEDNLIDDAVIAQNSAQFKDFWALRENITESLSAHGQVRKNDISLPIHKLIEFVSELEGILNAQKTEIELVLFGHIGDGNLHINYVAPKTVDSKQFQGESRSIELLVFACLTKFQGSISAEHGVGLTKKDDLHFTRTAREIEWMRKIKKVFDPNDILNPGKIF